MKTILKKDLWSITSFLENKNHKFDKKNIFNNLPESFIDDGLLDSFDLISLVSNLDKEFGISIEGTDIVPENFMNLASIEAMLANYVSG